LRYSADRVPVLKKINRVSKPGRRVYAGASDMLRVRGGVGVAIVSTSEGLMSDRDARRRNVGGEILCEVW
jgi:small subunit ribosomal protein S8